MASVCSAKAVEDEYGETRDSLLDVDPEQWRRINGMNPIGRIRAPAGV